MAEKRRRPHGTRELAPGLLLVFKPSGHRELEHSHAYGQRLRVLRGRLRVETSRRAIVLTPTRATLTLPARRRHATLALCDTWLVAERLARPRRERPRASFT